MNIRILAFLLVSVSFFVLGCNNDFCDDIGYPMNLESSGQMSILFIGEDNYPVIGGWWGSSADSVKVIRSDGQVPYFDVSEKGFIYFNSIQKDWDNDAFENKKRMDYYITLSSTDTDTISMEYQFARFERECDKTIGEHFIYAKVTYRDSIYHEFDRNITSGSPKLSFLFFKK